MLIACTLLVALALQSSAPPAAVVGVDPLEPDRPDVTNGTHIVDVGLLQLEFGAVYRPCGGPHGGHAGDGAPRAQ